MQRYLTFLALSFAGTLLLVAGFTRLMDPYGYWGGPELAGLNRYKPAAGRHLEAVKLRQIVRVQPATIVAGNSRVATGFDPESPAWAAEAKPVYNLGLPGAGTAELVDAVLQSLDQTRPRAVVFAVDFVDFRVSESEWRTPVPPSPRPAAGAGLREPVEVLLSLDALADSASALPEQFKANPAHTNALGFDSLAFYNDIVDAEGHAALFEQRHRENVSGFLRGPKEVRWPVPGGSRNWTSLERLAAECRRRGIALTLVTYPYHADLLLAFRQTGLWPAFEDWHRGLAAFSARTGTPVWDFSRVSPETAEPIPAPGDTRTRMRWYWEGGHFKAALGDVVIADLTTDEPRLGARLSPVAVEHMLAAKVNALAGYRLARGDRQRRPQSGFAGLVPRATTGATPVKAAPVLGTEAYLRQGALPARGR